MARRRLGEQTIFFPWERAGGFWRRPGLARARPFVALVAMIALLVVLGARERRRSGVRATRATLVLVRAAVDAYRADHDKKCPGSLGELKAGGYLGTAPIDAWGHPVRLTCPGRMDAQGYDLSSDGPDGVPGGLDRVE